MSKKQSRFQGSKNQIYKVQSIETRNGSDLSSNVYQASPSHNPTHPLPNINSTPPSNPSCQYNSPSSIGRPNNVNKLTVEQKCIQLGQCYYGAGSQQVNRLDTVRLAIPDSIIKKSACKGRKLGIHYIGYDTWKHCQIWEFSAKILKANYPDLISKHNISQFVAEINESELLSVDMDEFYNQVMVLSADFAIDLLFDDINEVLETLCNCVLSLHWFRQPYQRGVVKESVLFRSKARHKSSVQFYDKSAELRRPENLELMRHIDPSYFEKRLRAEFRFKKMDGFRSVWGFPSKNKFPLLKDLLESNINIPLTQFKKIIELEYYQSCTDSEFANIFERVHQLKKHNDRKDLAYWYMVVKNFKENRDDIDSFLRINSKSIDRDRKKLSRYLATILQVTKSQTSRIIKILLKVFGESNGK
jgi:hypothetical protein